VCQTAPFVFLSHSGADTEAAWTLKRRLENAQDAKAAGLRVWFDKDDLRPGGQWQLQIEQAIERDATAFVVYVGSRGVINWVDIEVRTALSRAATNKDFLFIPVLAAEIGADALPPFARLYHGVSDPLGNDDSYDRLLKAVLKADWDTAVNPIEEPFVGLRSMREEEADRFFGRDAEIKELVEKFRRHRIVAIVADSGTGKSSLAEAGFAPAFRGGALADLTRSEPDDRVWHVASMRPGANPEEGLRTGVSEAAEKLGLSGSERAGLRKRIALDDPSETAFALQCDLPARKTATLLIVDQFEELLTQTPPALAALVAHLLLALADSDKDIRILLTVRADYFNLVSVIAVAAHEPVKGTDGKTLFERLTENGRAAILPLKRISDAGLRDAIHEPLRRAGQKDEAAQDALVKAVKRDISDQPSDLPLMQVALRAAWREHRAAGIGLVEAYESVGGVLGALANEAEAARSRLTPDDQARLESIFVRLVRLGDTGGATRRTASLTEFDEARRDLVQQLGTDELGRLVVVGETSAEIAHEALITQWPWLQGRLRGNAGDVRRLDRLIEKAQEWRDAPADRKAAYLAGGAERESFNELAGQRPEWLSRLDLGFVAESNRAYETEREKEQRVLRIARHNESVALTALANIEAEQRPVNAAKLALAAWPRDPLDMARPMLPETLDALSGIVPNLHERRTLKSAGNTAVLSSDGTRILTFFRRMDPLSPSVSVAHLWDTAIGRQISTLNGHVQAIASAAFSNDGKRVVTCSLDNTARVWDAASGREIAVLRGHEGSVVCAAFSPNGKRIVTASDDGTARVWDTSSGQALVTFSGHKGTIFSAAFSANARRIATASIDTYALLWNANSGDAVTALRGHKGPVYSAAFSPDGTRVVTASADWTARSWDAQSGHQLAVLGSQSLVWSAAFSRDGKHILTVSNDSTARVWDAITYKEVAVLGGHDKAVRSAAFSLDGRRIVTGCNDGKARIWSAASGREIEALKGHEGWVNSADFKPDGKFVWTASIDKTVRLWEIPSGREIIALAGHAGAVRSATFSRDGKYIVTASDDQTARVWDANSGYEITVIGGSGGEVLSAAFSPDRKRVVTALADSTARIWDSNSGRKIAALKGHERRITAAVFSPDGKRVLTASEDKSARVWEAKSGREISVLKVWGVVTMAAFSLDGTPVILEHNRSISEGIARLRDAVSGDVLAELKTSVVDPTAREIAFARARLATVDFAAVSQDRQRIVTVDWRDEIARLWEPTSGREVAALKGHTEPILSAAFSPNGRRIVTASEDQTARIWDAAFGHQIVALTGHEERIYSASFDSDGTRVVTASADKTVRIWDVSTVPQGTVVQVAYELLRQHEMPVSLEGVTEYPLTFDRPICVTDPPTPDLAGAPEQASAGR
jgi:WD40 repeat protein